MTLVSAALRLYRQHFWHAIGLSALFIIPTMLVNLAVKATEASRTWPATDIVGMLEFLVVFLMYVGAELTLLAYWQACIVQPPPQRQLVIATIRERSWDFFRLWGLLFLGFAGITILAVAVVFLNLIGGTLAGRYPLWSEAEPLPASMMVGFYLALGMVVIIFYFFTFLATSACAINGFGSWNSLRESWRLSATHRRIALSYGGLMALLYGIICIPYLHLFSEGSAPLLGLPQAWNPFLAIIWSNAVSLFTYAFVWLLALLLYLRLTGRIDMSGQQVVASPSASASGEVIDSPRES
jgi:hypothetical protein